MKQNHHFPRRLMALFLSAAMVLGCTGMGALAAEDEDILLPEESETQIEDLEEETEEVSPQATVDPADASDLADDLSGSGTEADPFLIQNETDLRRLSEVCATHYTSSTTVNLAGVYFLQTADITLTKSWTSIGNTTGYYFGGIYDGGGYSVDLNGKSKAGAYSTPIFGCIRDASVHDLRAKGTVTNTSTTAGVHTAGVVGFASGASTIYNCVNEANVSGKAFAGGVVAELANTSSVTSCENYGTVTQTTGVYSSAAFGGVVGKNTGTGAVENCMNYGAVSYGAIASSNAAVGGVIGAVNAAGPVVNCGNQGAVNGEKSATSTYAGGVIGYVNKAAAVSGCYIPGPSAAR